VTLSETGESRVNGYLFVLERSLKTFLPGDVVRDAVREIESHVRERVAAADGSPDERTALERILAELGPPLRVAQAYSAERIIDEAVATGRLVPTLRAVWHLAASTVTGFFAGLGLFVGYAIGVSFLIVAALKPIFPNNVGLWTVNGMPRALGAQFPIPPGSELRGGYWIMPIAAVCGLGVLVITQRGARRFLAWWRMRRPASVTS
jgi:HAAS domain-containing protein